MGEGLLECGGGTGGVESMACWDCRFLLCPYGVLKGSLDVAESVRRLEPGLSGANDCWDGGSGF
jgi:hypothetical protein